MENQDRELLEMAAKAADYIFTEKLTESAQGKRTGPFISHRQRWKQWNPLTDDGDALRLAACLEMVVDTYNNRAALSSSFMDGQGDWVDGDDYKHAIVLLAADIGVGWNEDHH